jgi:2-succinyl-5-enolpyruvyl-6-hydroxy-3-cyclohexene-1-carboxylate synthase
MRPAPVKPSPNPGDAGTIVRRPTGLPITDVVIQPGSVVTPLALRGSALERCATREHALNYAITL